MAIDQWSKVVIDYNDPAWSSCDRSLAFIGLNQFNVSQAELLPKLGKLSFRQTSSQTKPSGQHGWFEGS